MGTRKPGQSGSSKKGGQPDLDRFRLRRFVEALDRAGEVERHENRIDLADIGGRLDGNPKTVHFTSVGPEGAELVGNVMGSRARIARALGIQEADLLREITTRLRAPIEPVEIASADSPVHEVVLTGAKADFTKLPIHLQHGDDGGPYLSATMDFSIDPETGWTNVGVRRHMIRGRRESGIDLVSPSDLRAIYLKQIRKGKPLPVSFVIGTHPADFIGATSLRPPCNELALLGAVRGQPVPVTRCVTNDVLVPADAEYVIEGYLDARGHVEPEGPYGEFLGYYGPMKMNPTFHLTAITHRRDALFQTVTQSGRFLGQTDTAHIACLRTESAVWAALETAIREPLAVYCTPSCGGTFNVRISMRQRYPGEARNAIAAAFGSIGDVKHVFVVDDDIDVYSDAQMDWALSTRFQADQDLVIASDIRAYPLDPSLDGSRTGAKAGFDLTIPYEVDRGVGYTVADPPSFSARRHENVAEALAEGPLTFGQIMAAIGSRDGRDVVVALEKLRGKRGLSRNPDGRYVLAD
jgi:2,5-furandicarboxylate decarboxylase 1